MYADLQVWEPQVEAHEETSQAGSLSEKQYRQVVGL
jgi:hypothetical protein